MYQPDGNGLDDELLFRVGDVDGKRTICSD